MTIPVKPINEIEEKSEVGLNDKILILDADTEEARLASKDELKGDKGDQGDPGTPGTDGQDGAAATIAVGTTSTLPAGSSATVTNSGTSTAAVFNFGIPKGDKGDQGNPGQDGTDGNGITSVTSSKVGKTTTVTMNFDEGDPYSFQVQDGADGTGSGDVNGPASSVNGDVVVFDGTTGKLIKDGSVALSTLSAGASAGATAVQPGDIGTAAACNTGTSSGNVPILDSNGKLATSTLPGVALTDTFTVSTSADLTTLSSAEQGDLAIVTTENKTYVLSQAPYSTAANWKEILAPTGGVTSVNGQTGAVTLNADNISDTSTTNKFVTQTDKDAWDGKQDELQSGVNIRTINGTSILGSGDITTPVGGDVYGPSSATNGHLAVFDGATGKIIKDGGVVPTGFNPGGTATTGYVVTKTASGYEWSAPSGGDVVVSSQANNILQSGMKIWAGTEANYQNLGSRDSNTLYLTVE